MKKTSGKNLNRIDVERLLASVNIPRLAVSLLGDRLVSKTGKNWSFRSPLRADNHPSCTVDIERGLVNDHGDSSSSGTVITLIQKMHGLDFPSACKYIADFEGIEMPYEQRTRNRAPQIMEPIIEAPAAAIPENVACATPVAEYNIVEVAVDGPQNRGRFKRVSTRCGIDLANTPEPVTDAFASIFRHKRDIEEYVAAAGKVAGYRGPVMATTLPFDLDSKTDPHAALLDARILVDRLVAEYGVSEYAVWVFYSGRKGFHILVADPALDQLPPGIHVPEQVMAVCSKLASGLKSFDVQIYKTLGTLRIPNSRHSGTDLFKIPLTITELQNLNIDEIRALATSRRRIEADAAAEVNAQPSSKLQGLLASACGDRKKDLTQDAPACNESAAECESEDLTGYEIAIEYLASIGGTDCLRFWNGDYYSWTGRCYRFCSASEMNARMMRFLQQNSDTLTQNKTRPAVVAEVISNLGGICLLSASVDPGDWIDGSRSEGTYLSLANGILDVGGHLIGKTEGILMEHTPSLFVLSCLPYSFDPTAQCPSWLEFLETVLPNLEVRGVLQESIGYTFEGGNRHEKFRIMVGEGANGKGAETKVEIALYGQENVSAVPLDLFDKPFSVTAMLGKIANICSELSEVDKSHEGLLKAIVSGEMILFERKFRESFTAKPTAKLVFCTNVLPQFKDRSNGLWRRMILIPFNIEIPEEKQDKNLADKIIKSELPGILNWALAGLRRLTERGYFAIPEECKAAVRKYQVETNSARRFLSEECVQDSESEIPTKVLYRAYAEFCKDIGAKPLNDGHFGREVKKVFPMVAKQGSKGGHGKTYWGIKFNGIFNADQALVDALVSSTT